MEKVRKKIGRKTQEKENDINGESKKGRGGERKEIKHGQNEKEH